MYEATVAMRVLYKMKGKSIFDYI